MKHSINIHQYIHANSEELSEIAQYNALSICDNIEKNAPELANRLLYGVIFSYLYNMLLIASPNTSSTQRAAQLQETLGVILATAGINIDAIIQFSER